MAMPIPLLPPGDSSSEKWVILGVPHVAQLSMQKSYNSHLKEDKRQFVLEPNMSDHDPGSQI